MPRRRALPTRPRFRRARGQWARGPQARLPRCRRASCLRPQTSAPHREVRARRAGLVGPLECGGARHSGRARCRRRSRPRTRSRRRATPNSSSRSVTTCAAPPPLTEVNASAVPDVLSLEVYLCCTPTHPCSKLDSSLSCITRCQVLSIINKVCIKQ